MIIILNDTVDLNEMFIPAILSVAESERLIEFIVNLQQCKKSIAIMKIQD